MTVLSGFASHLRSFYFGSDIVHQNDVKKRFPIIYNAVNISVAGKHPVTECLAASSGHPLGDYPGFTRKGRSLTSQRQLAGYSMKTPSSVGLTPSKISVAKLDALAHLNDYRSKWSQAYDQTIAFIRDNYVLRYQTRMITRSMKIRQVGSSAPTTFYGRESETRQTVDKQPSHWEVAQSLRFLREPNWTSLRLEIETYFGNLMDLAQNAVLQELINRDPSLKWSGPLALDVDLPSVLRQIVSEFWTGEEYTRANPYTSLELSLDNINFIEEYPPVLESNDLIIHLLDVKISWLNTQVKQLENEAKVLIGEQGMHAQLVNWVVDHMKERVISSVREFMQSSNHWDRLLENLKTRTSDELAALLIPGESTKPVDFDDSKTVASSRLLLGAAQTGMPFDRPTIILTPPGCDSDFTFKYTHFMQLKEARELGKFVGKAKDLENKLPDLILPIVLAALRGNIMVGHLGSGAFQSLVVTAKTYGCNVIVHNPPLSKITAGLVRTRKQNKLLFLPSNLSEFHIQDIGKASKYWSEMASVKDEMVGRTNYRPDQKDVSFKKDEEGDVSTTFYGFVTKSASTFDVHALMSDHVSRGVTT